MILRLILILIPLLSLLLSNLNIFEGFITHGDVDHWDTIDQELRAKLSPKASIVHDSFGAPRWSTYHAPQPGIIVNVAEENDVVETVKYCIENNIDFLTQSGAHGYCTWDTHKKNVIINMRGLNQVHVSDAKDTITFGGGALIREVVDAADSNQVETALPSCSCVGMSGATLGGGFNRLIGKYGFSSDNLLSVNLVTAEGNLLTVTPSSSPDLWWALRGAGANFGVVTSMTMKVYPATNGGISWIGTMIFSPNQLEVLMQTLSDFNYTEEMFLFLIISQPPPDFVPSLTLLCFYAGSEADAKTAFKALYDIGPVANISEEAPSKQIHYSFDPVCSKGLRRPMYTAGLKRLDPKAFRKIWDEYVSVVTLYPELNQTIIMIESYSPEKIHTFSDDSSAFPHRRINFLMGTNPAYEDPKFDPIAEEFGNKVREICKESSRFDELRAYINYGHGDEDPKAIYGENLSRLKEIKKVWDKHGRFSQYFPIPIEETIKE